MSSKTTCCDGTARLDDVTANEPSAVTGGTFSLYDRGDKTGVFIHDGGGFEIWKNGVYQGTLQGGK